MSLPRKANQESSIMASVYSQASVASAFMALMLLISLPPTTFSQVPPVSTPPTIALCTSRLLPLASCAPFVQGITPLPAQSCCDNLGQLYLQQPDCLCLLLNNSNFSGFPINRTLALELPSLCNVQINISDCSGSPELSPISPASQVSLGARANSSASTHTNSTVAASPMVQVAPRPTIMGLGLGQNSGVSTKAGSALVHSVILGAIIVLTKVIHWV